MLDAFGWGLLATSSLVLGGVIGCWVPISRRVLGSVLGFGAGVLISAVSYELVFEALSLGKGTGAIGLGMFVGAFTFLLGDFLVGKIGASGRGSAAPAPSLTVPLVLGIVLDGIPESAVIGLGILENGTVSIAMLVAVFISNLPEAVAGTTGMRSGGWSPGRILGLWTGIAVLCALATVAGFALFAGVPDFWLAFINAFAAGAILMMLANTMMPEAYERAGKLAGVFTVLGFATAVGVVLLERG